jgi:peroxiredoxin family protein
MTGKEATDGSKTQRMGTIMLQNGSLDAALVAFEIALGMQAMGTQMTMWFALYGVNAIKKPRSYFSPGRWLGFSRLPAGAGRNTKTDSLWQRALLMLNHDGATHLPLSQLNFFGAGPWLLARIMKKKGMASLSDMIQYAEELGVQFRICQTCVDTMACDAANDFVVSVQVNSVSRYTMDVNSSHYNVVL